MARFNSNHNGDSNVEKVMVVPSTIYNLTQMASADMSGLKAAMREQKAQETKTYLALLNKAIADINAEVEETIAKW